MRLRRLQRGLIAFAGLALCLAPAAAREVTADEAASLKAAVEGYAAAMLNEDVAIVIGSIPPKMFEVFGTQIGVPADQVQQMLTDTVAAEMAQTQVLTFDLAFDEATYHEVADGTPYVLIPTDTVTDLGTRKERLVGDTLALLDRGSWYFLGQGDATQAELLKAAYPEFADVVIKPFAAQPVRE